MSEKKRKTPQKYVIKKEVKKGNMEESEKIQISVGAPSIEEVKDLFDYAHDSEGL